MTIENRPVAAAMLLAVGIFIGHLVTHNLYTTVFNDLNTEVRQVIAENKHLRQSAKRAEANELVIAKKMELFKEALTQLGLNEHVEIMEEKLTIAKGGETP